MKSHMIHDFSKIPQETVPRSTFRRPRGYKTTFDSGYLVPIYVDEALPGDTFNVKGNFLLRFMSALNKPVMDNIFCDVFYFAVPLRLLWNNFKAFMGEQEPFDPEDGPTDYLTPQVEMTAVTGVAENSLFDYFGIPIGAVSAGLKINAFHSRAYNRIYNEWFRDENLIDSAVVDLDDGDDAASDYVLRKRGKRHDYFTSCLPWPQKGDAVGLALGTTEAPVEGIAIYGYGAAGANNGVYETGQSAPINYSSSWVVEGNGSSVGAGETKLVINEDSGNTGYPGIYADLSDVTATTINALREAFQMQRYLERDARGGTRYVEKIKSHFGVVIPDYRVQRSEFIGGGTFRVNLTPVAQTSKTDTSPQGNLASFGHGFSTLGFTKSFVEHSVIIGLINVRADLTYQQGLHRMWSRRTPEDFYFPVFSNLGEQAVLNKEIYLQGTSDDALTFGYQERWAEYRYAQSLVTGELRSTATTPLDSWHLAQEFSSLPTLSQTFIEEDVPIARITAVDTEPEFVLDSYFDEVTVRPMPTYSVPGLIDHF